MPCGRRHVLTTIINNCLELLAVTTPNATIVIETLINTNTSDSVQELLQVTMLVMTNHIQ